MGPRVGLDAEVRGKICASVGDRTPCCPVTILTELVGSYMCLANCPNKVLPASDNFSRT